jgi:hypothetical protein
VRTHADRLLRLAAAALLAVCASARADGLVDRLATDDPQALADAVAAIERGRADPDALYAAARACEDRLLDPARALALYDRIVREAPDARVAPAAEHRAEALHRELGPAGEHAVDASEAAKLVAEADRLAPDELLRRADALAARAWPGAPRVATWTGDWLCRHGRYAAALAHFEQARTAEALRASASCALDAREWNDAERLAERLPADDAELRDSILEAVARGRARERWYAIAWSALVAALAGLLGSFVETALRSPRRPLLRVLRPPIEIAYFAPIAGVLVAIAFTAHHAIAPAVLRISIVGLVAAWLSGGALELARSGARGTRTRALLHIVACVAAVVATGYLAITHDGLLDMLVETVKFGPEG